MKRKLLTNTFIVKDNHILLGMKQRGFGKGKWNGFGGKVSPNEHIMQGAIRECEEEVCITPHNITKIGIINFYINQELHEVHYFLTKDFSGTPANTEEMHPKWFTLTNIPYENMWQDDPYWMPLMLNNNFFSASFYFDDHERIITYQLSHTPLKKHIITHESSNPFQTISTPQSTATQLTQI